MTYKGASLEFEEDAVIALAGAAMGATVNDDAVPMYEAVRIEAGQELILEFTTEGARTYLAVAGGIDVEPVMESRSTYTLIGIGGYKGRTLESGDTLAVGEPSSNPEAAIGNVAPVEYRPNIAEKTEIRIVIGLCDYRLTDDSRAALCDVEWKVTPEANRVGYRLEGPELEFVEREQPFGAGTDPSNVTDIGYPIGSIQVPQKPIVLMQDAVTGGGYATVGTVISTDRNVLSQRRTHETITFDAVTIEEALEARTAAKTDLEAIRSHID